MKKKGIILSAAFLATTLGVGAYEHATFNGAILDSMESAPTIKQEIKENKVKANPEKYEELYSLIEEYEHANNFKAASDLYAEITNLAANDPAAADFLLKKLDDALVQTPTIPSLHYRKGLVYLNAGFPEKAYEEIKTAFSMDKSNPDYKYVLGLMREFRGEYTQAGEIYKSLIKEFPAIGEYRVAAARCYAANGLIDDAIREYKVAASFKTESESYKKEIEDLTETQNFMKKHSDKFPTVASIAKYVPQNEKDVYVPETIKNTAKKYTTYNFDNSSLKITFQGGSKVINIADNNAKIAGVYSLYGTDTKVADAKIIHSENNGNSKYLVLNPRYTTRVEAPDKTILTLHALPVTERTVTAKTYADVKTAAQNVEDNTRETVTEKTYTEVKTTAQNVEDNTRETVSETTTDKNIKPAKAEKVKSSENFFKKLFFGKKTETTEATEENVFEKTDNEIKLEKKSEKINEQKNVQIVEAKTEPVEVRQQTTTPEENLFEQAEKLANEKRYIEAVKKINAINPENFRSVSTIAKYYKEARYYDEAAVYYKKASALEPQNTDVLYDMAKMYYEKKDFPTAITYVNAVLNIDKNNENAISLKKHISSEAVNDELSEAVTLINKGEYGEAKKMLEHVCKIVPDEFMPYYYLGHVAYATKDYEGARANFKKAISLNADYPLLDYSAALAYDKLNQLEDALAAYQKFLRDVPDDNKYTQYSKMRVNVITEQLKKK